MIQLKEVSGVTLLHSAGVSAVTPLEYSHQRILVPNLPQGLHLSTSQDHWERLQPLRGWETGEVPGQGAAEEDQGPPLSPVDSAARLRTSFARSCIVN